MLIRLFRIGSANMTLSLPTSFGSFYILAFGIAIVLGAVASKAFRAHDILPALYHGATAPIALAFFTGIDTHGPS